MILIAQQGLSILFEDEQLLVLDKPRGISCVPDRYGGETMQSLIAGYAPEAALVHRLDHHTCGVLLAAKTLQAEQVLLAAFEKRQIEKRYRCIVRGVPKPGHAECRAYLQKNASRATVRITDRPEYCALSIHTEYWVKKAGRTMALLEVLLHTGRTHQIRAHLAHLGYPVLGDDKYGDWAFNRKHSAKTQALTAWRLELRLTQPGVLAPVNGMAWESREHGFPGKTLEV